AKASRLIEKDALDCYRLLLIISTTDLVAGFESHRKSSEAIAVTREGLAYFAEQRQAGADGQLRKLLAAALPGDGVALAQFDALSDDLLDALKASGIFT
ncbi:MAG TPA: hypothetical protein VF635_04780, partial [Propionibacteriaceae bacterium]